MSREDYSDDDPLNDNCSEIPRGMHVLKTFHQTGIYHAGKIDREIQRELGRLDEPLSIQRLVNVIELAASHGRIMPNSVLAYFPVSGTYLTRRGGLSH